MDVSAAGFWNVNTIRHFLMFKRLMPLCTAVHRYYHLIQFEAKEYYRGKDSFFNPLTSVLYILVCHYCKDLPS